MTGLALVAGAVALAAQTAAVGWASWRLARRWWPGEILAALTAAVVIGCAIVVVALEVLGSVGLLLPATPLLASLVVVGIVARTVPAPDPDRSDRPRWRWPRVDASTAGVAVGIGATVVLLLGPLLYSLDRWRPRFDALASHLPVAVQFVQHQGTWFFPYASPVAFSAHYPANAELLATWVLLPLGRDVLVQLASVPGLVLVVLATGLLARTLGARPWTAAAAAVVLPATPRSLVDLVGTNMQDLLSTGAAVATLAFAARRWHASGLDRSTMPDLVAGGLAAGLAIGTRYGSLLTIVPALLLLLAPVVERARRDSVRPVLLTAAAVIVPGAYFYVRNQWFGSSPVYPQSVPWHEVEATERFNFPFITTYLELGWRPADWRRALGYLWRLDGPLVLGLVVGALVPPLLAVVRRDRTLRTWVWAALPLAIVATFLATPAAPGLVFDGRVEVFSQALNLRYGIVLVCVSASALAAEARRLPARVDHGFAGGLLLVGVGSSLVETHEDLPWAKLGVLAVVVLAAAAGAVVLATRLPRRAVLGAVVAATVLAALGAPRFADRFDDRRILGGMFPESARLALEPYDGPVAVAGFCRIYGLYGPALDREVEYLTGDDDGIDRPMFTTRDEWVDSILERGSVAVVLGEDICYSELDLPYAQWATERPDVLVPLITGGEASVYLVDPAAP